MPQPGCLVASQNGRGMVSIRKESLLQPVLGVAADSSYHQIFPSLIKVEKATMWAAPLDFDLRRRCTSLSRLIVLCSPPPVLPDVFALPLTRTSSPHGPGLTATRGKGPMTVFRETSDDVLSSDFII